MSSYDVEYQRGLNDALTGRAPSPPPAPAPAPIREVNKIGHDKGTQGDKSTK
jgi:hypothetical protein